MATPDGSSRSSSSAQWRHRGSFHASSEGAPRAKLLLSPNWLLWLGAGCSATANSLGVQSVYSLTIACLFLVVWALVGVTAKQLIKVGISALVELYFREYMVIGAESVPSGPVIFVCGPHSNQFLDPIVVSRGTDRDIKYLVAAKSLRRKDVGWLFKLADPVPVERQQDLARPGMGAIAIVPLLRERSLGEDDAGGGGGGKPSCGALKGNAASASLWKVVGKPGTTKFLTEMPQRDKGRYQIKIVASDDSSLSKAKAKVAFRSVPALTVQSVLSDEELLLQGAPPPAITDWLPSDDRGGEGEGPAFWFRYQILPPVSHDDMFNDVYDHLGVQGGALGIFPEGGSHDRAQLLPLKVGVCIMALGAMRKFPGLRVRLVPVGLNYFSQHRFNSRVLVKYGEAVDVAPRLLEAFTQGGDPKRRAVQELLAQVQHELEKVTVAAPDWKTMKTFWVLRDLYCPSKRLLRMTSVEKVLLAQAFAADYDRVKGDPAVDPLLARIDQYARNLDALGIKDKANLESALLLRRHSTVRLLLLLVVRVVWLLSLQVVFGPVYLCLFPVYAIATLYSRRKSRQAVENSSVKLKGRDVMGTYKVIIALPLVAVGHWVAVGALYRSLGEPVAVAYFFFAPFAQFVVYKSLPSDLAFLRSTWALAMSLLHRHDSRALILERTQLKEDARSLIDRLEWGMGSDEVQSLEVCRQETLHFSGAFGKSFMDPSEELGESFSRSLHDLNESLKMEEIERDLFFKND